VRAEFRGDYVLTAESGVAPTSIAPANALRRAGVATVVADERTGDGQSFGQTVRVAGVDPGLAGLLLLTWKHGSEASIANLGANQAILASHFATSHDLSLGSPVTIQTPTGQRHRFRVAAVYTPPQSADPLGTISIATPTFDSIYHNPQNLFSLITTPGGVTTANSSRLNAVLSRFPDAQVRTAQQFIDDQEASIRSELNLIYILLALSIVVSLFGIVNTLVLTVFERTRELGMLRAIGMTRRQTRRMIRYEAVIIALLGAALGITTGVGIAALFDRTLDLPLSIPWSTLVTFVLAAILVGMVAAVFPARRAARLDILTALQHD
jgi:ABC-type antimicrobial peptide transport system permease subunit